MADYWKKKLDELNQSTSTNNSQSYWDKKTAELEKKNKSVTGPIRTAAKKKKKEEERKWFNSGLFEDGYDFGDITKTILGSGTDLLENASTGIIGMGEKALDSLLMLGTAMNNQQLTQNAQNQMMYNAVTGKETDGILERSLADQRQIEKETAEYVKKDLYNEEEIAKKIITNPFEKATSINVEDTSVFGEKSDALIQSGGQLLGTAGLQMVGVPWFVTTGATAFGSQAEQALNEGASFNEANASALISAGAEILTEKLSGGIKFGGKTLDDVLVKSLTEKISSKTLKTLANLGLDAVGEGSEEVVSSIMSNLGTALYKEDKVSDILFSEEAVDEYIESFIGGSVLGGVSSGFRAVRNGGKETYTENEQKVIDKEVENRIAELEQDGKTLTKKEKNKIREEVLTDLDKGSISIDTIERALGGEAYENYKSVAEQEEALQKEFDTLNKMRQLDMTGEQIDRRNELKQQLEELKTTSNKTQLKDQLSNSVFGLAKDSRLSESYNEQTRKSQYFETDLNQYDEKQRAIVQKAIDSKVLNNTNRTHDFVDMVAKISAEKGVLFDFTNNEKLKGSEFAVEGKTVNGFVNDNGDIVLNMDSHKAHRSVVGHEITHILEGTELYTELQEVVKQYATTKGEYAERMQSLRELYTGVYKGKDFDEKIQRELTADMVGDYLFSDTDFVNKLSTEKPNLFKKIYNEIKYLYKVATAGSKEARELEKVKRAFDKAYKESGKAQGNTKYSLSDSDGKQLTKEQQDYFKDSKARDEKGNLKVVYHGTRNADFTVFKRNVNFFTDNKEMADSYSPNGEMFEGYLNIKKPYEFDAQGEKWSRMPIDTETKTFLEEYGGGVFKEDGKWRTTPADIASAIEEAVDNGDMDYDGIIIRNIDDTGSYYKGKEKHIATDYIVFNSNQFKNANNKAPTFNPDIRFSLSESVEETKDLIAVHNLSEEKLLKSLKLGGLPMPSIAIARAKEGHSNFGTISLVFSKDTISPTDRRNKVYSGDAWTPTYPRVEYEVSDKEQAKIEKRINSLVPEEVIQDLGGLHLDSDNLQDDLNKFNGNMADAFRYNAALKYAFLVESGTELELPTKNKPLGKYSNHPDEAIIRVAETVSEEKLQGIHKNEYTIEQLYEIEPEIRKAVNEYLQEKYKDLPEEAKKALIKTDALARYDIDYYAQEALNYLKNGLEQEIDYRSSRALIDEAVDTRKYEAWVNDLFANIVQSEGIRNNKDLFTSSGNRRSFKALHYEHNLENVIKAMKEQGTKGVGAFGGGNIFGASTQEYGSIAEIKEDAKKRMKLMSEDEYDALRKGFSDRMFELAYSLPIHKDSFSATDDAANMLIEAVSKFKTKSGMANYLRTESKGWANYSDYIVDDLVELVNDIRNMPVGYFEAKPQRAVGFNEVATAIIPDNTSAELKQILTENGVKYIEYEKGNEQARVEALNSLDELKFSLSKEDEIAPIKNGNVPLKDLAYRPTVSKTEKVAPVDVAKNTTTIPEGFAPMTEEEFNELNNSSDRLNSLTDEDMPPIKEAPYYEDNDTTHLTQKKVDEIAKTVYDYVFPKHGEKKVLKDVIQKYATSEIPDRYALFDEIKKVYGEKIFSVDDEDLLEVQNYLRKYKLKITDDIKAEYPEYADFMRSHRGRLLFSNQGAKVDDAYQELSNLYPGYFPDDIWNPADQFARMVEVSEMDRTVTDTWELLDEDIQKSTDIIADEVARYKETQLQKLVERENRAFYKMSPKYWEALMPPIAEGVSENTAPTKDIAPERAVKTEKQNKGNMQDEKIAQILMNEPKVDKKKGFKRDVERFMSNFVDRAAPIETLALKTGNRELDGKFNTIRYADTKAQTLIGEGANGVKSINDIFGQVGSEADLEKFYNYLYHKHNVDRMSLESREAENLARLTEEMHQLKLDNLEEKQLYAIAKESTDDTTEKRAHIIETVREYLKASEVKNKPVYGDSVTAQISQEIVEKYEFNNPEFVQYAEDVYNYNRHLRNELVEGGVISQETADLFEELYPHYVPIRRLNHKGIGVNVPLDTRKTGINAPIKRAQGGNSDILPLAQTMAQRTLQTYKAVAKNRFGVELKNTLGTTIESTKTDVDEIIESVDTHEELLKEGKHGANPTFTVFENGEKVTFEITEAIYDALKPTSEALSKTYNVLSKPTGLFKKLVTEYNPAFMLTNPIKDTQDVLLNSQHPLQTYKNYPKAIAELFSKGKWYSEYMKNGGSDDSYFDKETNTFTEEKSGIKKVVGFPLEKISEANNFLERLPRLAEYIASREMGRSEDVAMLDSARVTTNFRAGGDVTKFLNRNGVTFLNPSVQGAVQQVRNIREAKANGLKGWGLLATKVMLAGLPGMLLNGLLWDDDEDYEELSDYVKQNYYVVWKNEDGKFIRIPKGRALAVIQNAFTQVQNALTGDDEVDIGSFLELVANNIAPNNPLENNILAPIMQVKNNKTWYGEDLVPSRLQDLPTKEQFDESTDKFSRWLGDKLNVSPVKVNYLLNQYSGGVGDMLLPMLTPEAESGKNSLLSNFTAPIRDKFTTDSVMNNQNVSNFYEVSDELKVNANSSEATEEDILKNKYFNAIRTEMSELYKEKREIQNNEYLNDSEKYNRVREVQEEINALSEEALNSYNSVAVDGKYAEIGDKQYKLNSDNEWQKISDEEIEKQNEVIGILGITKSQYWNNKKEYDMKAFYPEKYKVLQEQGISVEDYKENYEEMAHIYTDDYSWASDNPEKYTLSKAVTDDVSVYKQYTSDLYNIKADKDSNGKSISGSRKEKVHDYIFDLDIEDGAKYILFKSEYNADDTYNYKIIDYLNEREDISYEEMVTILKELDFEVDSQGNIYW